MRVKIFISYAHEDQETAEKIYEDLKRAGLLPWLDSKSLLPGQIWESEIKMAIRDSDYVISLLSSKSVSKRGYVQKELKEALDALDEFPVGDIYLIPVRIDQCKPVHDKLSKIQWVDLFPSYEDGFQKIINAIQIRFPEVKPFIYDRSGWKVIQVLGSSLTLKCGIASTIDESNSCPAGWFSGESTVILGSGEVAEQEAYSETVASWDIPLEQSCIQNFMRGFLVFGCIRYFGGVHSQVYGALVEVMINDKHIDRFGLKITPPNHSDYFHRIAVPNLPDVWPLSACQTVYAWPIFKNVLSSESYQTIRVKIDQKVSWDIDYVAIVCQVDKLPQKVFLSHNWKDKNIARRLAKDLGERGIGTWLDEAEIKLGDSLVEKIRAGIDTVEYLIVLLSAASVNSEWVKKEVDIAMNQEIEGKKVKVLPVLLENCDLPGFLKGKLYADLTTEANYDSVLRQIEERLQT